MFSAKTEQSAAKLVLAICAAQIVLWTLSPMVFFESPPLDVVENMVWGKEWRMGYYKHPPLQAWLSEIALTLGGGKIWAIYLLSQLCIASTFWALFLLGRDVADARTGLRAVVLFSLVYYATIPTPEFNANVVQMPIWAFAGWLLWRSIQNGNLAWWALLGAVLALGVYAKYSVVFLVVALIGAGLSISAGRASLRTPGPYLASGVCFLLSAPHFVWLVETGYQPINHAMRRLTSLEGFSRLLEPLKFLLSQIASHAAPIGLLLIARARFDTEQSEADERRYVDLLAILPLGSMVFYSLVTGGMLKYAWATPAVTWISLAVAMRLPSLEQTTHIRLKRGLWLFLFLIMPLAWGLASKLSENSPRPQKTAWHGAELAELAIDDWTRSVGGIPTIIAGPTWEAGLIAYFTPHRPSGFLFANFEWNPWIDQERLDREGALFVWIGPREQYDAFGPFVERSRRYVKDKDLKRIFHWAVRAPRHVKK